MSGAVLSPTEDQIFDTVWGFVSSLFDPSLAGQILKSNQNLTSTPQGTYAVVQPSVKVRLDQGDRDYDPVALLQNVTRHTQYSYQVDCYGPSAPDWADIISSAWRSMWACDQLNGNGADAPTTKAAIQPLYADEPQQLTIVNGEFEYEQRFMVKLYLQANQVVGLPQDFFTNPPPVVVESPPADYLPQ
jgi:hypothetical protein